MRDEITAGLKNALERGYSLEEGIQTFINAGYNPVEVKEAANMLTGGATSIIKAPITPMANSNPAATLKQSASQIIGAQNIQPVLRIDVPVNRNSQSMQAPQMQTPYQRPAAEQQNKSSKKKMILLIGILTFLIALLLIFIIYKEQILDYLSKAFK